VIAARRILPISAAGLLAAAAALTYGAASGGSPPAHFADAADPTLVALGKHVYMEYCASCHGRALQGQPLWQLDDAFAGRRAPAQDQTGHTWQHADEDLFRKTKDGRFPTQPADAVSPMPAFATILDDRQILAALAFIKSRWPVGIRVMQALLNPGNAGMPANAENVAWRLPPICMAAQRPPLSARIPPRPPE
jgi:mono/diheme cytochrome c family protein